MAIDYVLGRPLEVEAIHGETVRRAESLGIRTPALATLYAVVRAADLRHRKLMRTIPAE
jgi:ketopantoate reductase